VVTTVAEQPFTVAKIPVSSWTFAIRVWLAMVLALFVSFWLQLEAPASAAVTVGILAEPTRGQALDKAAFRLLGTVVGVTASIAITGLFSQARDLILIAFAVWIGICVLAANLLDGYRAYAAVLSGYTVALIATQQIDTPRHVFESGMARGAAIAVGILSMAVINTLMYAPDRHPRLIVQLAVIRRRVREYASAAFRGEAKLMGYPAADHRSHRNSDAWRQRIQRSGFHAGVAKRRSRLHLGALGAESAGPDRDRQRAARRAAGVRLDRNCHDQGRQGRGERNALAKSSRRTRDELLRIDPRSFDAARLHSWPFAPVAVEGGLLARSAGGRGRCRLSLVPPGSKPQTRQQRAEVTR
jgi:uncharacterized membrane protein YccC